MNVSASRTLTAGLIATAVMLGLLYAAPLAGYPRLDVAGGLGWVLSAWEGGPAAAERWFAMVWHLLNGVVIFPAIYVAFLRSRLPGHPAMKGAIWGLALWAFAEAVLMPVAGLGFFGTLRNAPPLVSVGVLLAHLVYGVVLGGIARSATPKEVLADRADREREAA